MSEYNPTSTSGMHEQRNAMLGKWTVIALSLTTVGVVACRKTPTAVQRDDTPSPLVLASQVAKPNGLAILTRAIASYEGEPTGDRAVDVWMAFAEVDSRLSELKREVARRVGGSTS